MKESAHIHRVGDMNHPTKEVTKRKNGSLRIRTVNLEPSRTDQSSAAETDVNNIMKKYETTGQFTHLTSSSGTYADFSQITDYRDMLETVRYADEAFASLPAAIRLRFKNDPSQLLEFIQDRNNYDEGVSLGLIDSQKIPPPLPAPQSNTNDSNDKKTKGALPKNPKTSPPSDDADS